MCFAQTRSPQFIVASVKPTAHGRDASGLSVSSDVDNPSPETLRAVNNSLAELIRWAFQVKEYRVSGPAWLNDDSENAPKGLSCEGTSWARIHAETTSIADLAGLLSERLGRPVIDTTGIETQFRVDLEYRFDDNDIAHPTIFNALQELGLRVVASKGPVEILVIDRINKVPAEN